MDDPAWFSSQLCSTRALSVLRCAESAQRADDTLPGDLDDGEDHLVVYAGASSWRHPIGARGDIAVGRGAGCDLRIDDTSVSRRHARIAVRSHGLVVEDLGSRNGTFVDGERVSGARPLPPRARVRVGDALLVPISARPILCDRAMVNAFALLARLAPTDLGLLLCGETGTGKELAATYVHVRSPRARGPFVALSAGSIEAAAGGTLFVDELADLPAAGQAALLRAVESGSVRVVAATERDPAALCEGGWLRRDLYFRLAGATVRLPPLRERPRELPMLARAFAGRPIAPPAMALLAAHPWPGNVRELRAVIESALVACGRAPAIEPGHLPEPLRVRRIDDEIRELEEARMLAALRATGGNQKAAAALIGMPRRTFVTKLARYGLRARS